MIDWQFNNDDKKAMFLHLLARELEDVRPNFPVCTGTPCQADEHCLLIGTFWEHICECILKVGGAVYLYLSS